MNEAQRKAVTHGSGPLLVLAGPGSGKTTVITRRTLFLIKEKHIPPDKILVLTFTREAAASMKNRFLQLADQNLPVRFGTFHSLFLEILKKSNHLPNNQKLMTAKMKRDLLRPLLDKMRPETQNSADLRRQQEENRLIKELTDAIGFYKNTGDRERTLAKIDPVLKEHFDDILHSYEIARIRSGAIDYDDMIHECAQLLETDGAVRARFQAMYSHILLDEFQDINPEQYRILKLLKPPGGEVFAVGDDDQSIYAFRGSDPLLLQRFKEEYSAETLLLNINYRSPESVVQASLRVINANHNRFTKDLLAARPDGHRERPVYVRGFLSSTEQDAYIIDKLRGIQEKENAAVLFRTNVELICFASKLKSARLKFTAPEESIDLYSHTVSRDIIAYLRLAVHCANPDILQDSLLRIANKPERKFDRELLLGSEGDVEKLAQICERNAARYERSAERNARVSPSSFVYEALQNADETLKTARIFLHDLQMLAVRPPFLAVPFIRKVMEYDKYLKDLAGDEAGLLDEYESILDWMSTEAKQYENIKEWLEEIDGEDERNRRTKNMKRNNEIDHERDQTASNRQSKLDTIPPNIHLMTVHSAKGLEFDHVFIPGCNEGNYPRRRRGSAAEKEKKSREEQAEERRYREEERRVFYVGMTRAKKSLELSYLAGTKDHPRLVSGFLNPLL